MLKSPILIKRCGKRMSTMFSVHEIEQICSHFSVFSKHPHQEIAEQLTVPPHKQKSTFSCIWICFCFIVVLWVCVCVCCGYMCKYMHKCVCLASYSVALHLESLACGKHILVHRLWAALGPVGQPVGVISLSATGSAETPRRAWVAFRQSTVKFIFLNTCLVFFFLSYYENNTGLLKMGN